VKYNPALDGLRAVAVFVVVIYHAKRAWMLGGWAGVDVFFVLSGYLITTILASEFAQTGRLDFRRFYWHRVLRLAPALIGLYVFQILRALIATDSVQRSDILKATIVSATYFMNWSRAFDLFPQDVLGHTWSLSMEEQFYITWPIIFICIRARRPEIWIISAACSITLWRVFLSLSGADPERTYNGLDTHADALLIGCLLALSSLSARITTTASRLVIVPVVIMACLFGYLPHRTLTTQTLGLSVSALGSAWIILSLLQDNWLRRLLSIRPIVYSGRISYGWYLWHFPILVIGKPYLSGNLYLYWAGLVALIAFSYGVAVLSFEFVETPFLRLKARLDARTA
jgi:peptidoglycan/LPS O-acetylase OafA/YrhL